MRCFPRKGRHQWVFFLILLCLFGVYLAYKRLLESEDNEKFNALNGKSALPEKIQKIVHTDLKLPKAPVDVILKPINSKVELPPLIPAGRVLENDDDYVTNDERKTRLKLLLLTLSTSNWKSALDPDEVILLVKSEFMDMLIDSSMSCKEIDSMKSNSGRYQGSYGKKIIDYVRRDYTTDYVFKSVGRDTELKIQCMKMDYKEDRCQLMANYKLVKELVLFQILSSPSVIKLHGYCLRGDTIDPRVSKKGVILVTEAGKPIQSETFNMLPWNTKVEICIQLLKLLLYLDESPVGSLRFDKLHIQDFVLLNADIKLVDLDNLFVGETQCFHDEDCVIKNAPSKRMKCVEKVCKHINVWNNLFMLNEAILTPLLKYVPNELQTQVKSLQEAIANLRISTKEVLKWFQKHSESGPPIESEEDDPDTIKHMEIPQVVHKRTPTPTPKPKTRKPEINVNQIIEREERPNVEIPDNGDYVYDRFNNANYPGRFDFHCDRSRVSWGCVLTVTSLQEAKSVCNTQSLCTSFVLFSSNPDRDDLMTAVMKSAGNNDHPDPNHGATLYRKRMKISNKAGHNENKAINKLVDNSKTDSPNVVVNVKSCLSKVGNSTKSARSRREKRLLTHLGLKGIKEEDWKAYAQALSIDKYIGLSSLTPTTVDGGKFKFEFEKNALNLRRGEFSAELGPFNFHVAHLIAYHLDRVLGLYHLPPTVSKMLSESQLNSLHGEKYPLAKLKNISSTNVLHGIVTVPMPPVMKTEKINIDKRDKLVLAVPEFSRDQKVQLEYILLWALTKMTQPPHGFLGYKGHLIHFEADLAFQSLHKSLTGYFYNCKFPNTVYKLLVCYKCPDKKVTTVCGLGFEVIRRVKNEGVSDSAIKIGSLKSEDLINVIDNSASSILMVVEQCIKKFSRETVLY
ncbi:hypothetical protein ACF0H5_017372 [Mactra antiquata]